MTDIMERLRHCRWLNVNGKYINEYDLSGVEAERLEAADEIERLRALGLAFLNCQTEENAEALRRACEQSARQEEK